MKSLNGKKTHPLSEHAKSELRDLCNGPIPRQVLNPGTANRLLRGELVISYMATSPFVSHRCKKIEWFRISEAGRSVLAQGVEPK